jgi:Mg2+/citrate symporter
MSIKPADYPFWLRVVIVITLAMFAVNVFFFLGPLVWFATTVNISPNDVGSWLGALFSTFIGAFLAFLFGIRQRERQRVNQEVTAGNLALSTLYEMWERQLQFQREVVEPFRNRRDAWLNLTIGTPLDSVDLKLDRNDLGFVL